MKETMTVHKALAELKVLDSRINSEITGHHFVVPNKHSNAKIGGVPISEYVEEVRGAYKSIRTLINRRNAIKRAITRSNAQTFVKIAGVEYTVAEAIDMKSMGVSYLSALKNMLESQYANAKQNADKNNGERLEQRTDEYIRSMYTGVDMKNLSEEIKKVREDFVAAQTVELIDPVNAAKEVAAMNEAIDNFTSEVDSALSVSNALTTIEVEYETF